MTPIVVPGTEALAGLIPDAEILVGRWLREHPDLTAMNANVGPRTPTAMTRPWIRVTQLDASDSTTLAIEHLIEWMIQLDCYAGSTATEAFAGQAEASRLTRTARAVLKARQGRVSDGLVVSRVVFGGQSRIPDTSFEPALERFVLTVLITGHRA